VAGNLNSLSRWRSSFARDVAIRASGRPAPIPLDAAGAKAAKIRAGIVDRALERRQLALDEPADERLKIHELTRR
jgi:hypothetical protein